MIEHHHLPIDSLQSIERNFSSCSGSGRRLLIIRFLNLAVVILAADGALLASHFYVCSLNLIISHLLTLASLNHHIHRCISLLENPKRATLLRNNLVFLINIPP